MRDTYCFLALTLTVPLDPEDIGLEPLSWQTWAFSNLGVGLTLAHWKLRHKTLAAHLTSYQVITPTKKIEEVQLPKGRVVGKPNGVFHKPGQRSIGKIHIRTHDYESTTQNL